MHQLALSEGGVFKIPVLGGFKLVALSGTEVGFTRVGAAVDESIGSGIIIVGTVVVGLVMSFFVILCACFSSTVPT